MISRKQLSLLLIIAVIVISLVLVHDTNPEGDERSLAVAITFCINGFFAIIMLVKSAKKTTFSCVVFHWLFCIFFLFVAPFLQYVTNSWALNYHPLENELLKANLSILIWMLVFSFAQGSRMKLRIIRLSNGHKKENRSWINHVPTTAFLLFMLAISLLLLFYMLTRTEVKELVSSRSGGTDAFESSSQMTTSLLTYSIRNFFTFTAFFSAYRWHRKKDNLFLMILSFGILLLGCFPVVIPRYQAATIYLGLFVILYPDSTNKNTFIVAFVVGLLIVFPLLNVFRYTSLLDVSYGTVFASVLSGIREEFTTGNYDAYVMLLKVFNYIDANGHTYGRQLLGTILFFVPRKLWPNKPVGTGAMIQYTLHIYGAASNVSSCMVAEAVIDFGILGLVVYPVIFSSICKRIDARLSKIRDFNDINEVLTVLMPPLFFFLLRGSLQSVFAFIASFVVIGEACLLLFKFFCVPKNRVIKDNR